MLLLRASDRCHWRGNPHLLTTPIHAQRLFDLQYYVYILSNVTGTTIYIGVTRDLIRRVYEHKNHLDKGSFTDKYDVTRLVYFETTTDVRAAIEREKQLKGWNRGRKNKLISGRNPNWEDLYESILP